MSISVVYLCDTLSVWVFSLTTNIFLNEIFDPARDWHLELGVCISVTSTLYEYLVSPEKINSTKKVILPGIEPGISGSVDRRLIHWATGPVDLQLSLGVRSECSSIVEGGLMII